MTDFKELAELIEKMGDEAYMLDNDLNLSILDLSIKNKLLKLLDLKNRTDVSRFLTMVICFSENGLIDDEMIHWSEKEYKQYLKDCDITEGMDKRYVEKFVEDFTYDFF